MASIKYFKKVFFLILFLTSLSLFAQTFREIKIYVPPVSGEGNFGDSTFFYNQLTYEVIFQHHLVARTLQGTDYTLRCMLLQEDGSNVFFLEMIDNFTEEVMAQQYITYTRLDTSVENYLAAIVFNMLSVIPGVEQIDGWRNNWLFLGASILWSPRLYHSQYNSVSYMNLGIGFQAEWHFMNSLSVGAGLQFTQDWVIVSAASDSNMEFRDLIMEIPLSLKLVLKPSDYLMLKPYTGICFNISLMEATQPSALSWFAGFQFGVRAGPGIFFIDSRFAIDFFKSYVTNEDYDYHRSTLQIGLGYKQGFFQKR